MRKKLFLITVTLTLLVTFLAAHVAAAEADKTYLDSDGSRKEGLSYVCTDSNCGDCAQKTFLHGCDGKGNRNSCIKRKCLKYSRYNDAACSEPMTGSGIINVCSQSAQGQCPPDTKVGVVPDQYPAIKFNCTSMTAQYCSVAAAAAVTEAPDTPAAPLGTDVNSTNNDDDDDDDDDGPSACVCDPLSEFTPRKGQCIPYRGTNAPGTWLHIHYIGDCEYVQTEAFLSSTTCESATPDASFSIETGMCLPQPEQGLYLKVSCGAAKQLQVVGVTVALIALLIL